MTDVTLADVLDEVRGIRSDIDRLEHRLSEFDRFTYPNNFDRGGQCGESATPPILTRNIYHHFVM